MGGEKTVRLVEYDVGKDRREGKCAFAASLGQQE